MAGSGKVTVDCLKKTRARRLALAVALALLTACVGTEAVISPPLASTQHRGPSGTPEACTAVQPGSAEPWPTFSPVPALATPPLAERCPPAVPTATTSASSPTPGNARPPRASASADLAPSLAAGAPVSTELSRASETVAGMAGGFRLCYNRGLRDDGNMKGSIRITAKIGASGDITKATTSGGKGLSDQVVACLVQRVETTQFPPPCGGGATVVIPISFFPPP